jgi:DNA-binding transcriptional regulator YhcF (GntR family)
MNNTQLKIMNYLTSKVQNGEKISSLQDLADELGINYFTLSDNMIKLNKLGKVNYKSGKILNVYTETYKGNVEYRKIEQHKNKYSIRELEEKYDKCVKEIVCEYINAIDPSSFTNDNLNKVLSNITNITNKLKEKLFK